MKKIITVLFLMFTLVLVACGGASDKLFISKYFEATEVANNAIELYNDSDKDINLKGYSINIYANGSKTVSYNIPLTGKIEAKGFYLITSNSPSNETLKKEANLQTKDLLFNGNDAIELINGKTSLDVLGVIGSANDFGKDVTLIKKPSMLKGYTQYEPYAYIPYNVNAFKYAKTMEGIADNQTLLDGPVLSDEYRSLPYVDPTNPELGGGGVITVKVQTVSDGDTAVFYDTKGNTYRMRYYFIDTREVIGTGSPTGMPWGYTASALMKDILGNAMANNLTIEIQSIKGQALTDNYGRYLGLVWVDGKLANFMVVRAGMSNVSVSDIGMSYLDIPYHGYLQNAWNRASLNDWGIHGDQDPNWDYAKNAPIDKETTYGVSKIVPDYRLYNPLID